MIGSCYRFYMHTAVCLPGTLSDTPCSNSVTARRPAYLSVRAFSARAPHHKKKNLLFADRELPYTSALLRCAQSNVVPANRTGHAPLPLAHSPSIASNHATPAE